MKAGKPSVRIGTMRCLLCATALTLILALIQALPTYASQNAQNGQTVQGGPSAKGGRNARSVQEAETEEITFSPDESSTSADSKATGHTRAGLISVVVPVGDPEFQMGTGAPFQIENPGAQTQSPGIQIRNLSVVPIELEISQMAEAEDEDIIFSEKFSSQTEQSFQLVDRISNVGVSGTAILALGEENRRHNETSFEKDAIVPGRKSIFITDIPAEETRTLKPCGKTAPGFYGEYQFTVRPTLKVSAIQTNPSG